MWSQWEQNHISSPDSFTARVRSTRLELHIGHGSGDDGIRSNANFVNRHTGHKSLSRRLSAGSVGRVALTDAFSVVPHDEHSRNPVFKVVDSTFVKWLRSKVNTL
jgi:hypothetical protein